MEGWKNVYFNVHLKYVIYTKPSLIININIMNIDEQLKNTSEYTKYIFNRFMYFFGWVS